MAANLDKAESSLTTVSDVAFVRAVDASGNSVKISKSDLASVLGVGGEMKDLTTRANEILGGSYFAVGVDAANCDLPYNTGALFSQYTGGGGWRIVMQVFISFNSHTIYLRDGQGINTQPYPTDWSEWKTIY